MTKRFSAVFANRTLVCATTLVFSCLGTAGLGAQNNAPGTAPVPGGTIKAVLPVSEAPVYNNKYELFGGLLYANGQAGQNLPKHYNMGGGDVMGTYWLRGSNGFTHNLGIAADYRIQAGTTPVLPSGDVFGFNRILVYQNIFAGGVQYRGPRGRYAAIDYHALAGASHGTFDTAITHYPCSTAGPCPTVGAAGVYSNRTSSWDAVGASVDFNYLPRVAIRLQPDLVLEHFGTELREFVSISGGVVYRFKR